MVVCGKSQLYFLDIRNTIEGQLKISSPETDRFEGVGVDRKAGKVNFHFFNSHLASLIGKLALSAGAGAAIVAYSPSVVVIPALVVAKTITIAAFALPTLAIVACVATALFIFEISRNRHKLLFEISLLYTMAGKNDWWNPIDQHIVLGAIPLGPEHAERLVEQEEISAVLTMLEDFEVAKGLVEPISAQQWADKKIDHLQIQAKDFIGVPVDQIQEGVAFLEKHINQGKKVYVHCKAGRGRSATIVVAYLLKKKYAGTNTEFKDAYKDIHDFVKRKRPQINLNPNQQQSIERYYELHVKAA